MHRFYKLLWLAGLIANCSYHSIYAQDGRASDSIDVSKVGSQWVLLYQSTDVRISVKKSDCIDKVNGIDISKLLYRIENLTPASMAVQWDQSLVYSNKYILSSDKRPEYRKRIAINANQTIEGSCELSQQELSVFVQLLNPRNEQTLLFLGLRNIQTFK